VNDEIQFGEIEQAAPERALRPDENRHYAVVAYGEPAESDLPIFVDLDVLAEMEDHALSNTSVELGGVLLGGCYDDERGRPFVVITDSLRAEHYESTKGSFKFTHDTWSAITRQRDEFPPELQMVGWYHTHPDWGVFLSGMDMFICDNFFNKKLDVAYVIDPCRGDRGMFQWTGNPRQRVRRTGGFFVTASRFRAAELEHYVSELSSNMPGTISSRSIGAQQSGPVVHLHQPREPQPPWQALAIAGALAMQFLLVALIAWKTLTPSAAGRSADEAKVAAALEKLNSSLGAIETRQKADLAEARARARTEFLDQAFRELRGADDGAISRLQARYDQTAKLEDDVSARDAEIREMKARVENAHKEADDLKVMAKRQEKSLKSHIDDLSAENSRLQADVKKKKEELTALNDKLNPKKAEAEEARGGRRIYWWWIGGGALAAVVLVAGVWWVGSRAETPSSQGDETAKEKSDSV
jgi:proteasome lid subunit RPN8/RPN11